MTLFNIVTGGQGTMANAADGNGGGYAIGGTAVWGDFQGTNGGPIATVNLCTLSSGGGGNLRITDPDTEASFLNVIVGTLLNAAFSGANGGNYNDGRYEVVAVDVGGNWVEIDLAFEANGETANVIVGGALAKDGGGIQDLLDLLVPGVFGKIATDVDTATVYEVPTKLDADGNTGTFANHIIVHGVDKTNGVEVTRSQAWPILRATGAIASIVEISGDTDFYEIRFIDLDCDNTGVLGFNVADTASRNNLIYNCRFQKATSHGVSCGGRGNAFVYCEGDNNGGDGIITNSWFNTIIGGAWHDNAGNGITDGSLYNRIISNHIYDNQGDGGLVIFGSADFGYYANNTSEGNAGDGAIIASSGAIGGNWINNSFSNNGEYGIDFVSTAVPGVNLYFAHNHSYNNTSGHSDQAGSDSAWRDLGNGNNDFSDPQFFDIANHIYTPDGNNILNNGFPDFLPIDGDPLGVANFALIGALRNRIKPNTKVL